MKHSKNSICIVKISIALGIIAGVIILYLLYNAPSTQVNLSHAVIVPEENLHIGGNFTLINQDGKRFKSSYLNGHLSLIYFGVTYSLDDYNALKKIVEIVKILSIERITVQPVFITLDPQHDDSSTLKEYLKNFDTNIIGLTGTSDDIKQVTDKYKVFYYHKQLDQQGNYKLEHFNFVYLLNSSGKFLKHYCLGLPQN